MLFCFILGEHSTSVNIITPEVVRPFPRATKQKAKKENSRKGKSRILTDTPEKSRLEEIEHARERRKQIQQERNQRRVLKQIFPVNKRPKNATQSKRTMSTSSSNTDESIVFESDEISDDFGDMEMYN